jgi:hypothetical protein
MATSRSLDEQLSRISETRRRPRGNPPKGTPPLRARPPDFEIIFVQIGRIDCEVFYRAARITIDRWLDESGKDRLLKLRRDYVAHQRAAAKKPARVTRAPSKPVRDRRRVSFCLARHAAQFLRQKRNGGWMISYTGQNDWWVGCARKTSGQLLDMALAAGFDAKGANLTCELEDKLSSEGSN